MSYKINRLQRIFLYWVRQSPEFFAERRVMTTIVKDEVLKIRPSIRMFPVGATNSSGTLESSRAFSTITGKELLPTSQMSTLATQAYLVEVTAGNNIFPWLERVQPKDWWNEGQAGGFCLWHARGLDIPRLRLCFPIHPEIMIVVSRGITSPEEHLFSASVVPIMTYKIDRELRERFYLALLQ